MEEFKDAIISQCKKYRYTLMRRWDKTKPLVGFIGLNPSTADANQDDPTIRRCRNFSKSWGYGGMIMVNLFAFRATDPKVMKAHDEPVGDSNDFFLNYVDEQCPLVVACWGNHGSHLDRDLAVYNMMSGLDCLKVSKSGQPAHPLYLKADLKPKMYLRSSS